MSSKHGHIACLERPADWIRQLCHNQRTMRNVFLFFRDFDDKEIHVGFGSFNRGRLERELLSFEWSHCPIRLSLPNPRLIL